MNGLIERYMYDVARRLPEGERDEVRGELESCINDMLPDNPSEQDIVGALTRLGSPRALAEQYRQKPRYLISPAVYEQYISVLKIVIPIVACAMACLSLITATASDTVAGIIANCIGAAIEGALQVAFWITIGFTVSERIGFKSKQWTVDDLPRLPDRSGVMIKRSSSITGMAMSVFFMVILAIITRGERPLLLFRGVEVIYPFSQEAMKRCFSYVMFIGGMAFITNCLKLYWAKWNVALCVVNALNNIVWVSAVIYILHWPDLLSDEFISFAQARFNGMSIFPNLALGGAALFFSAVFFVIAMVDTVKSILNTRKSNRI